MLSLRGLLNLKSSMFKRMLSLISWWTGDIPNLLFIGVWWKSCPYFFILTYLYMVSGCFVTSPYKIFLSILLSYYRLDILSIILCTFYMKILARESKSSLWLSKVASPRWSPSDSSSEVSSTWIKCFFCRLNKNF